MSRSALKGVQAAAGNAGEAVYVEDVFSTYVYEGTGSTQTITNGIDLAGEGGLIWSKRRDSTARTHILVDSVRGATKVLNSQGNYAEYTISNMPSSFNSNGYTIGTSDAGVNNSGDSYVSWTFRKAPKFFDVVTYTGTGSAQTVSHNLGSTPGLLIVKATSSTSNWFVLHTGIGKFGYLDLTQDFTTATIEEYFGNDVAYVAPTDSVFSIGSNPNINVSGTTYVAYLFAHNDGDGEFGESGDQDIIKCGIYTSDYPNRLDVNLGFEPQWILVKSADTTSNWIIVDNMRGIVTGGSDYYLKPNSSDAEGPFSSGGQFELTPTGFTLTSAGFNDVNFPAGTDFIYIAIRRPMKTPESGTEVFAPVNRTATAPTYYTGFVTDMQIMTLKNGFQNQLTDRLRGQKKLLTNATDAESAIGTEATYDWMTGVGDQDSASSNNIAWNFKRATGFFDVVAYTGNGTAGHTVNHNLGVTPECMIVKRRDGASSWITYWDALGATKGQFFDTNQAFTSSSYWNDTAPTETQLTLGSGSTNTSSADFIAYLFASVNGVSKVGSYTGTGSDLNVDCGFSAGARFVLVKRTDSTGDWYVWDTERGIVAGNDPYLLLNSTAAEVTSTDYIDPLSSGFTITSSAPAALNASGGTYIFLAIA